MTEPTATRLPTGVPGVALLTAPAEDCTLELGISVFLNIRHYVELGGQRGPLHDHSWRLEIVCQAPEAIPGRGVVVEFAVVRERVQQITEAWNDQLLNSLPDFLGNQPTAENAATALYQKTRQALADLPIRLQAVTLWENPTHFVRVVGAADAR